uniref:FG-GAP repeat-containing protein n=2 Tax=Hesperocyparis TaxID=634378 RepID=A0A3S6N193_9CONI|nr:FG-GAP repeat-containing protein [Hesperocyparis arizonica]ATG70692.1 FG-GAP repeat-containing protein [Hesperocyparis bakeri]
MRKRDLGILMLAAIAIFFCLQNEGDFSFREAWFHLTEEYPFKNEAEHLPSPLITDLNGDGRSEILVATHDAKIQVLEPHVGSADEGFSEARLIAEVSLLPERVRIAAGRRPVAMSTGFIDSVYKQGEIRKQILVVVTAGWSVMCFDHNLKKLWETNIQEDFPHGAHHREVAISISNYTLKHGDVGLVIVGGRMELQPHLFLDPFEEAIIAEKNAERHQRSVEEKEGVEAGSTKLSGQDLRHFSYYAFAGRSGIQRWKHRSEDLEHHLSDSSELIPQYNYKLDAQALNSRRPGEVECKEFRESILGVMPHHWERREDTKFELAHFRKHKRKTLKKVPGKKASPLDKLDDKHVFGKDTNNKIVGAIGKAAEYAASSKKRKRNLYFPMITNHTQLWWIPNVLVAHQKEGIEAIHLASGRTICKLHLQEGGLHADINGDGVLDHVQAVGGGGAEQIVSTGTMEILRPCWAVASSGVPVREQLFNASICRYSPFGVFHQGDFSSQTFGHNTVNAAPIEVATPILIPRNDGHKHQKGSHGDVIFLTSRGEVTSYAAGVHGQGAIRRWQLLTGSSWSNLPSPAGMVEEKVVPTLKALALHVHGHGSQEVVLVAGEQEATIISPSGSLLASFLLPSPPILPLLDGDFSNDGLTDLVLVTSNGIYGFVQTRQPGALFFSSLVGCLIIVMAVILVSQHFNSTKSKPRAFERKSIDPR